MVEGADGSLCSEGEFFLFELGGVDVNFRSGLIGNIGGCQG